MDELAALCKWAGLSVLSTKGERIRDSLGADIRYTQLDDEHLKMLATACMVERKVKEHLHSMREELVPLDHTARIRLIKLRLSFLFRITNNTGAIASHAAAGDATALRDRFQNSDDRTRYNIANYLPPLSLDPLYNQLELSSKTRRELINIIIADEAVIKVYAPPPPTELSLWNVMIPVDLAADLLLEPCHCPQDHRCVLSHWNVTPGGAPIPRKTLTFRDLCANDLRHLAEKCGADVVAAKDVLIRRITRREAQAR